MTNGICFPLSCMPFNWFVHRCLLFFGVNCGFPDSSPRPGPPFPFWASHYSVIKIRILFLEIRDSFSEIRRDLCSSYFYCKSNSLGGKRNLYGSFIFISVPCKVQSVGQSGLWVGRGHCQNLDLSERSVAWAIWIACSAFCSASSARSCFWGLGLVFLPNFPGHNTQRHRENRTGKNSFLVLPWRKGFRFREGTQEHWSPLCSSGLLKKGQVALTSKQDRLYYFLADWLWTSPKTQSRRMMSLWIGSSATPGTAQPAWNNLAYVSRSRVLQHSSAQAVFSKWDLFITGTSVYNINRHVTGTSCCQKKV